MSGETLAQSLRVSRTAIWKAVSELKREGYPIEAGTNRGYVLSNESRLLSVQGMMPWLSRTPADVIVCRSIDSTNNEAKRRVAAVGAADIPFGTVIIAEEQTAGRGRRGRSFFSPAADSIYLSFILKPDANMEHSLFTTIAAAAAVSQSIEIVCGDDSQPQIKWVNDVFVDGKKVCGILTEAISDIESGEIESLILGIGININVPQNDFPKEIRATAGSVGLPAHDRNRFTAVLIDRIFSVCGQISNRELRNAILEDYRRRSMMIGKSIRVIRGDREENAVALEIGDDGSLLVEYPDGRREALRSGEVSIRNAE